MTHTVPCAFEDYCKETDLIANCHLCSLQRTTSVLRIECELSNTAVSALINGGFNDGAYKKPCLDWEARKKAINKRIEKMQGERNGELSPAGNQDALGRDVMIYLVNKVLEKYS